MRILIFLFMALYSILSIAADQVTTPTSSSTPAATAAPKQEAIGQVIWAKGQVSAFLPNQEKRILSRKAEVYKEDTVESDKSSTAQINLTMEPYLRLLKILRYSLKNIITIKRNLQKTAM